MADEYEALLDPARATTEDEFEATWNRLLPRPVHHPAHPGKPPRPKKLTAEKPPEKRAKIPRVGTTVQRSSATTTHKMQALLETPPRSPPRCGTKRPLTRPQKAKLRELFGDLTDSDDDFLFLVCVAPGSAVNGGK